jgi:hypothetical protein
MGLLVGAHFYLQKRERVAWLLAGPPPFPTAEDHGVILKDAARMVIPVEVELKCLVERQRDYPWPKPERCPRCQQCRVWGHGFVAVFFDGIPAAVYLKRFRCPGCRCVIRLRPKGYFRRFQASIACIYESLSRRIGYGSYPPGISRSRQRHWLRALQRQVAAYLGEGFRCRLLEGFLILAQRGRVPVASNLPF